jgi:ABC-type lipoprotein export system ATPase subunit
VEIPDVIRVEAVRVEQGGQRFLAPTSFRLGAGRSLALTGPSGSGKTTLIRCLAGALKPTAGSVWVDGCEVSALSRDAAAAFRRRRIGIVHQDPFLMDELTVAENVALPLVFAGVRRASALAGAEALLAEVDMAGAGARMPLGLSRGEAQRVAVARALAGDPAVVLADEPTASLDAANASHIAGLLVGRCRGARTALVLATHDMGVTRLCDERFDLGPVLTGV